MRKGWEDRNYLPVLVAEIADLRRDRISSATGWASTIFTDKRKEKKNLHSLPHSLLSLPVSERPFGLRGKSKESTMNSVISVI